MKRGYHMKKFLITLIFLFTAPVQAQLGCMDKSQHGYTCDGYDYKKLHYVQCACPCERYPRLDRRGQCIRCGHYSIRYDGF